MLAGAVALLGLAIVANGQTSTEPEGGLEHTHTATSAIRAALHGPPRKSPVDPARREAIRALYEGRGFEPIWWVDRGAPRGAMAQRGRSSRACDALVAALALGLDEGLGAEEIGIDAVRTRLLDVESEPGPEEIAAFDLAATDAYLAFAAIERRGRFLPRSLKRRTPGPSELEKLALELDGAARAGTIELLLVSLWPQAPDFARLREERVRLASIAASAGWPPLTPGKPLARGATDRRVLELRARLAAEGDLSETATTPADVFDVTLEEALRRYQLRRGLEPDGVAGRGTQRAMQMTAADVARTIEANLERRRWLPRTSTGAAVMVNLAGFVLDVVDGDQTLLSMRVVVGRKDRRTPVFSSVIRQISLNPHWHVPRRIAVEDLLPVIQQNPRLLRNKKIRVYARADGSAVDPSSVDWSELSDADFPYRLRQDPGAHNSLGRIKFVLPNPYGIYLHDTSAPELFDKSFRCFSAGCIRIEKPRELAELLLGPGSAWTRERLDQAIESGRAAVIELPDPRPVHVVYWTAWVDPDGRFELRPDLYGGDAALIEAMHGGDLDGERASRDPRDAKRRRSERPRRIIWESRAGRC